MSAQTAFETLGVPMSCSLTELQQAFRRQALLYHPDRNARTDANARMAAINRAYDVARAYLRNPPAPEVRATPSGSREPQPRTRQRASRSGGRTNHVHRSIYINGLEIRMVDERVYVNGRLVHDGERGPARPTYVGRGQSLVWTNTHVGPVVIEGGTLTVQAGLVGDVTLRDGRLLIDGGALLGNVSLQGDSFFRLLCGCHSGQVRRV